MTRLTPMNRWSAAALLIAAAAAAVPARAADPSAAEPTVDAAIEPAISRPSEERKLAFAAPGKVADVMVKDGEVVHAGQALAQQDDSEEREALRSLLVDANSLAEIDYEKVDQAHKTVVYKRKQELYDQPGHFASLSEVDEARLAVQLAVAQIAVADQKHDKAGAEAAKEQVKIDHMRLTCPIDGIVQRVVVRGGEMADPASKDGAIVVVKNDPIWVEFHPSSDRAQKLQVGQELQVRYAAPAGEAAAEWHGAKVIYFAPQADASSKTELVRLELPNPAGQRSGLTMEVRLPANVAAVAAGPAGGAAGGPALPPLAN